MAQRLSQTQERRFQIQCLYNQGFSAKEIIAQGYNPGTVKRWIERFELTGDFDYIAHKSPGRPRKATADIVRSMVDMATNEEKNLRELPALIQEKHGVLLCKETCRVRLMEVGAKAYARPRRPPLSEQDRRQRVQYAKDHKDTDWSTYVFCDEAYVERNGRRNARNDRVWVAKKEDKVRIKPRTAEAHPDKIAYFGAITSRGPLPVQRIYVRQRNRIQQYIGEHKQVVGVRNQPKRRATQSQTKAHQFRGRMTAKVFVSFVLPTLIQQLKEKFPEGGYTLVLDGAKYHTAKMTTDWLDNNGVRYLLGGKTRGFPPRSPDFTIVENCWGFTKYRTYKLGGNSISEVDQHFQSVWANISQATITKLYDDLPNRMQRAIDLQGAPVPNR